MYSPIDKKIKSPRQIEKKAEKVATRTELKQSDKSKMGKRNKRCGNVDEKALVKRFAKYGLDAEKTPGSGVFGGKYSNDVHLHLPSTTIFIENKRRKSHTTLYKLSMGNTMIEGFALVLCENSFMELCKGKEPEYLKTVCDKGFETVKKWIKQDNAQVVSVHEVYKEFVFVVPIDSIKIILKGSEKIVATV